jgi:hypothetical protein
MISWIFLKEFIGVFSIEFNFLCAAQSPFFLYQPLAPRKESRPH